MGESKRRRDALANGNGDRSRAAAHAARARRLAAESAFGPALEAIVQAVETAPEVDALWAQFAELVRFFNFRHPLDARLRASLQRALEHPSVDPGDLVRPISTTALSRDEPFAEPLLLRLLEETLIRDPRLEELIVRERHKALTDGSVPLDVVLALAHQCFNTEYVFAPTERLAAPNHSDLYAVAVYAAFQPLGSLPDAEQLAKDLAATPVASLAQRQIIEPSEELRLRAGIASLGETASTVSAAVRNQYEQNPYPRWKRVPAAPVADASPPSRVLIAGCGTGQHAIATAMRMPHAKVLAVDLSMASLAYAKRKALELRVPNIEYRQADLLALRPEHGLFDHVEASGVLHHLEDPMAGWRVLASLLEPAGTMRIGLYSERGRRAVVRARELIAERGFEPTPDGIRACRAALREHAEDELFGKIVRNEDFYSMSGCRDLLFHVQEHRFDLPQVKQMIETLGLAFAGFEFADSGMSATRYTARYPRDAAMLDLDNWELLEREHPDTFSRMYQFRVLKPR
jgi:ubiquinone/menaquinone biosynthesis C-methylase UbiE